MGRENLISQSDRAVILLQDMIEIGELKPGSMVSEHMLMELTGLGRTPVREAIQRLALTHILRIHPNKGIEIPPLSVEDQLSRLEVRRALELLAVTLACARATTKDLADIGNLGDELKGEFSLASYIETVRQTHALIVRAAHNPYLEASMTPLQTLSRRFWIMNLKDEAKEISIGKTLHGKVLRAIKEQKTEDAKHASLELNDYLTKFSLESIAQRVDATIKSVRTA